VILFFVIADVDFVISDVDFVIADVNFVILFKLNINKYN